MVFERGPVAESRAAADPFWSVVLRRHPDVDLVLLPPAGEGPPPIVVPEGTVELSGAEAATAAATRVAELWRTLVGDDVDPDETRARWTAGPTSGLLRHEATWTVLGADPVEAMAVVDRAGDTLRGSGWRVLAPPDGMPRVLAGRDAAIGREEADFVFVPATGRLFLRLRSGLHAVVASDVAGLLEGGA